MSKLKQDSLIAYRMDETNKIRPTKLVTTKLNAFSVAPAQNYFNLKFIVIK